ncbi:hypothetical protein Mapa_002847 [Marchantia paleacea]|nr:hypothetical protein Mapa_002847 [Marchantia paleacea]
MAQLLHWPLTQLQSHPVDNKAQSKIGEFIVAADVMASAELAELAFDESVSDREGDVAEDGVLLYYKFSQIDDPEGMKTWLFDLCCSLGLLGRIRVAPDGINITVGGKLTALQEHIRVVSSNPLFKDTDFKIASCSPPVNPKAAAECGFTSLSARAVKELVTLGLHPSVQPPAVSNAGRHATAQEFHEILQDRAQSEPQERSDASLKQTIVVDARNVYETRIGKFSARKGVEVMDPMVRQYSDLPGWIDDNEDRLRNKQILMYCTGGVRCEMASAYIRSKGKEFEDVVQLSGGIQRYMEAFPDGGYFVGKNFVFDHRLAVPSSNKVVVGRCLQCNTPYDDYSARCRCSLCRMLVLVCGDCQVASQQSSSQFICEICNKTGKSLKPSRQVEFQGFLQCEIGTDNSESKAPVSENKDENQKQRKLRILCLHGFRQNASKLKGRLNAVRKKLRHKVEFVYIDAPHDVPSFCQQHQLPHQLDCHSENSLGGCCSGECSGAKGVPSSTSSVGVSRKFAWLISPDTAFNDSLMSSDGTMEVSGMTHLQTQSSTGAPCALSMKQCLPEGLVQHPRVGLIEIPSGRIEIETSSEARPSQHQTQTLGWSRSWKFLQTVFTEQGPFDGVLGFSQGAAIAAALCLSRISRSEHNSGTVQFRFVIICSGFISPAAEHFESMSSLNEGAIDFPSLHVFGGCEGSDRQISVRESEQLASLFRPEERVTIRHQSGHIIPTQPEYVQQYLSFLDQF